MTWGGKSPFIRLENKSLLDLYVIGIDISQSELNAAPTGAYNESICADIAKVNGCGDGDLVICQAVLEHVKNTEDAFRAIASLLKVGGIALIFVPSRNAVFARLNLLLPQKIKEKILYGVYPTTRSTQGFPSYYRKCTPNDFLRLAKLNNLEEMEARYYYISSYFSFLFPLYMVWRIWICLFRLIRGHQAAETFSMALVKRCSAAAVEK